MSRQLDMPIFDADNHMYETTEAFTKYLPAEYGGLIKYVEVNGRTKIAIKNQISEYIPNPTFNKVAQPGAQELEFKLKNPSSKTESKPGDLALIAPPRYITSPPAFFNPAERLELMNEQGIDRALMWPTLASLLEERLSDDPVASHVVVHALNEWMHEHWGFVFENRIFTTPVITLSIVDEAIKELDYLVERGARVILIRPATVPDFGGRRRSFALPEFDPFWKRVEEAGVLVGMHSSDDGYTRYTNEWDGIVGEFQPFAGRSVFSSIIGADYRGIKDTVASIIGHGLATRFPNIRFLPVENGTAFVKPLMTTLKKLYARDPSKFPEDPMETWKRSIYVHPFFEEDIIGVIEAVGPDNVCFGSDYPHPEGMFDPLTFIDELDSLTPGQQAKIMGGNLATLMGVDPLEKIL